MVNPTKARIPSTTALDIPRLAGVVALSFFTGNSDFIFSNMEMIPFLFCLNFLVTSCCGTNASSATNCLPRMTH